MVKGNILSVRDLVRTYGSGSVKTFAVRGISFDVGRGEFVSLSGPSGSGKSTTFHQISLLDTPTSGKIFLDGVDVSLLDDDERSLIRLEKVGYVFQNYGLLPELTALENVFLPLLLMDNNLVRIRAKAQKVLKELGLGDRGDHYPSELSGGEQQRVAIARALVKDPLIILADEPTANLDSATGKLIMETLRSVNKKKGITIFVINHEKEFEKYFDRIIRMRDGLLVT